MNTELTAKLDRNGQPQWSGFYANPDGLFGTKLYVMRRWDYTGRHATFIGDIRVTNKYCGKGKGWDVILFSSTEVTQHFKYKAEAQQAAEAVLDNYHKGGDKTCPTIADILHIA